MPTYNALEVMDQIAAPFQQGLTRAHELQRAAAGARVARSTQIGDLTAKRQYDAQVAQQQHQQGLDRIAASGAEGRKTAEAGAAADLDVYRKKQIDIREQTREDWAGKIHAWKKRLAKGTGTDANNNPIGGIDTGLTDEQIAAMGSPELEVWDYELKQQFETMVAGTKSREELIDYIENIKEDSKDYWAKEEAIGGDDTPLSNMTREELADLKSQIASRIWKFRYPNIVKTYDDHLNARHRILFDSGWAQLMSGRDERNRPVNIAADVQADVNIAAAMIAQDDAFYSDLSNALPGDDNKALRDSIVLALRNGNFREAVDVATRDADSITQVSTAMSDALARVDALDQGRQLAALNRYLMERQGNSSKLIEINKTIRDLEENNPFLLVPRSGKDVPRGFDDYDEINLRAMGLIGAPADQGVPLADQFQVQLGAPPAPPAAPLAPAPAAPLAPAPETTSVGAPPSASFDPTGAASAAQAFRPQSGKGQWIQGEWKVPEKVPAAPSAQPSGLGNLTNEGVQKIVPGGQSGGTATLAPAAGVELQGGIDPRFKTAKEVLGDSADYMAPSDAIDKAKTDANAEIYRIKMELKRIGATRDAKDKITIGNMRTRKKATTGLLGPGQGYGGLNRGWAFTPARRKKAEEIDAYNLEVEANPDVKKSVRLFSSQSHKAVELFDRYDDLVKLLEKLK